MNDIDPSILMSLKYVTLHQVVNSGSTECPNLCSWSPIPLVFKKSRLLASFPEEGPHGPPISPVVSISASYLFHTGTPGSGRQLPLQCDLPKPPALAQHWLYGPCPRFPIVFKQTWGAEERLTTDRNLKPNPFAQISQAPGVTSLHLSADALGQVPVLSSRVPRSRGPDKGGSSSCSFNLGPMSFVFTCCTGIGLILGGQRIQVRFRENSNFSAVTGRTL